MLHVKDKGIHRDDMDKKDKAHHNKINNKEWKQEQEQEHSEWDPEC